MDIYSLEDDEGNDMFLTQEFHGRNNSQSSGILRNPLDFQSPCVSILGNNKGEYSDISDDDFMKIPSSQMSHTSVANYEK